MEPYEVQQHAGRVVLPPTGVPENYRGVTTWDDSLDNLEAFAAPFYPNRRSQKRVVTKAVLVHRSDNAYNPNAISVSLPAASGKSRARRHLGYLRDGTLRWVGVNTLPDLIAYAEGEVECTVILNGVDEMEIDLPKPIELGNTICEFLLKRGVETAGPPKHEATPRKLYTHKSRSSDTNATLTELSAFPGPPEPVRALDISSTGALRGRFDIRDGRTGRFLGELINEELFLEDERDRDDVIGLLDAEGVPVTRPRELPIAEDGSWAAEAVPNAWTYWRSDSLDIRSRSPQQRRSPVSFAIYNPTLRVLWVEDSRLVAPALRYASRLGLDVEEIGLPRKSWGLDDEISWRSLRDADLKTPRVLFGEDRPDPTLPTLLKPKRSSLPPGLLDDVINWVETPVPLAKEVDPATFWLHQRFVRARRKLFPEYELATTASCRLCGRDGAAFTTPISNRILTYCAGCLGRAVSGAGKDKSHAATAMKTLSDLEFDGQPFLESQLDSLHVNPAEPVAPELIDQLLLLRMAIARDAFAWTLLLEAAGFAEDGLRTGRGTLIRSRDGHLCLSMREKAVCDFLHLHGVMHEREPMYPYDVDYNPRELRRADWVLEDGTLVELWGLPKDPAYAAKIKEKRLLVERHSLQFVEIFEADLPRLPELFAAWIPAGNKSGWTWSPLLVVAPSTIAAKKERPVRGDDRGRNDYNAELQRDRVARCARAVELQRGGASRAEIGTALGAGAESVAVMLRDGKFYADPSTDHARYELAERAAEARERRVTRDQFRSSEDLSKQKALEVWRDAGVLFGALTQSDPDAAPGERADSFDLVER